MDFGYDPETKHQEVRGSLQYHRGWIKQDSQPCWSRSLIYIFESILHSEFLPQGHMINQQLYKEILWSMLRSVCEKRQELWKDKSCLLHHDSPLALNAISIQQLLDERNIPVLEQRPYSPNFASCDCFSFPQVQEDHQGVLFWPGSH